MKKTIILTITLALIAGISGFLLSSINNVTEPIIEQTLLDKENDAYKEFFSDFDHYESEDINDNEDINYVSYIYNSSDELIGYVYNTYGVNGYGSINALVAIDTNDNIVGVNYIEFAQTPGFGDKVQTPEYLGQFDDQSVDTLQIDAASGATFSSKLVDQLVSSAVTYHKENV